MRREEHDGRVGSPVLHLQLGTAKDIPESLMVVLCYMHPGLGENLA